MYRPAPSSLSRPYLALFAIPALALAMPASSVAAQSGACTPATPRLTRYRGVLQESSGPYRITVDFTDVPTDGPVRAHVTVLGAENRVLDGELPGTLQGGRFSLSGIVEAFPYRWEHRLEGTLGGATLRARSMMRGVGNAEWTRGEVTATARAGVDPEAVGTWAMVVPGAAYTQELDRGSYVERVQRASAGAPAGVLRIAADGRYLWRKKAGTQQGRVTYCETPGGKRGWAVSYDGTPFFVGFLDGPNGGFYLFSVRTGDYVYRGQAVR